MQVTVYSFNKSQFSTKRPDESTGRVVEGTLKDPFNRESPIMTFREWSYDINYMSVSNSKFGERYYWVSDVTFDGLLTVVSFTEDYLATFRSDILTGGQYVARQQNVSTPTLADTAYLSQTHATRSTVEWGGRIWSKTMYAGVYILGVENTASSVIGTTYYAMDYVCLSNIRAALFDPTGYELISGSVVRLSQYITSARWIPVELTTIKGAYVESVVFGATQITVNGSCKTVSAEDGYIEISKIGGYITPNHPQYTAARRWLNSAPYRTTTWYIHPFGTIEMPGDISKTGVYPNVLVDVVSSTAILRMLDDFENVLFETSSVIGVDIGLSARTVNVSGMLGGVNSVVSGTLGAVTGAVGGNAVGVINGLSQMATGVINTTMASVPQASQISTHSGNIGQYFEKVKITVTYKLVQEYSTKLGYAVEDYLDMGPLEGYTYCRGAELRSKTATASERAAVEALMNSGIYIDKGA